MLFVNFVLFPITANVLKLSIKLIANPSYSFLKCFRSCAFAPNSCKEFVFDFETGFNSSAGKANVLYPSNACSNIDFTFNAYSFDRRCFASSSFSSSAATPPRRRRRRSTRHHQETKKRRHFPSFPRPLLFRVVVIFATKTRRKDESLQDRHAERATLSDDKNERVFCACACVC